MSTELFGSHPIQVTKPKVVKFRAVNLWAAIIGNSHGVMVETFNTHPEALRFALKHTGTHGWQVTTW